MGPIKNETEDLPIFRRDASRIDSLGYAFLVPHRRLFINFLSGSPAGGSRFPALHRLSHELFTHFF